MALSVDLFWSFRSPYSYLATGRIVGLAATYDLSVVVRPVYPIAIRTPGFFKHVNPLWIPYLVQDTRRAADYHAIPFAWPKPDPVVMDMETRTIAEEQPHIHRLTRLGVAAVRRGRLRANCPPQKPGRFRPPRGARPRRRGRSGLGPFVGHRDHLEARAAEDR